MLEASQPTQTVSFKNFIPPSLNYPIDPRDLPNGYRAVPKIVPRYVDEREPVDYDLVFTDESLHHDHHWYEIAKLLVLDFELPFSLVSELTIYHESKMFQSAAEIGRSLYNKRPKKGDLEGRNQFQRRYERAYHAIAITSSQTAFRDFSDQDDLRITISPKRIEQNRLRFAKDPEFQTLFKRGLKTHNRILSQQQIDQIIHTYYVLKDMSQVFLDLSLGDIGFMKHSFEKHSMTFYAVMLYLDLIDSSGDLLAKKYLTSEMLGRIIWSLEQNEHSPEGNLHPFYLAKAMTAYSQLLCSLEDALFTKTALYLLLDVGEKARITRQYALANAAQELDIPAIKRWYQAALFQPDRDTFITRCRVYPRLIAGRKLGDSMSSRLIETINDTHFGQWLWEQARLQKQRYWQFHRKVEKMPTGTPEQNQFWHEAYQRLQNNPELASIIMEMTNKSLLQILFISDSSLRKQLEQYGVNTHEMYDCEIIGALVQTIVNNDPGRILDFQKFMDSLEMVRFRFYLTERQFKQVITALNNDKFPSLSSSAKQSNATFVQSQDKFTNTPPVYLFIATQPAQVVPIDKDSPLLADPTSLIEYYLDQNIFAGIFIHYPVKVDETKLVNERGEVSVRFPTFINVEIQVLPRSIQKYYHDAHRKGYVDRRIGNGNQTKH